MLKKLASSFGVFVLLFAPILLPTIVRAEDDNFFDEQVIIIDNALQSSSPSPSGTSGAPTNSAAALIKGGLNNANAGLYNDDVNVSTIVGRLIRVVFGLTGIICVIICVVSGILYMTAAGDTDRVKKAKSMLIQAIIGLIILSAAYAITGFVITELGTVTSSATTTTGGGS